MAIPRVFVSSTCYDLKYIREELKYFIEGLGYEPVLSEEGDVFYDPKEHTHDACINEVKNSQIFVLIIGGRYGGKYKETDTSITNYEYRAAVEAKLPVFTLIDKAVYGEHFVYQENKSNPEISKIKFPSVDNTKVFDFINEVRRQSTNNAFSSFSNFSDIEDYLKKQWAGMMFNFLQKGNETERVEDMLTQLELINKNTEMLSKQILKSVGTEESKKEAKLYETLFLSEISRDFSMLKKVLTPQDVLKEDTFESLLKSKKIHLNIIDTTEYNFSSSGNISRIHFNNSCKEYNQLKEKLKKILVEEGMSVDSYIKETK